MGGGGSGGSNFMYLLTESEVCRETSNRGIAILIK